MLSQLWRSRRPRNAYRRVFDPQLLGPFRRDTRGGVLAYVGVMLPVLLGVSGLALDGSLWLAQKRSMQAMADVAALSLALEVSRTGDEAKAKDAAKEDVAAYGFDESSGDKITLNIPPKFGAFAGSAKAYEVIVQRPAPVFLAGLFMDDNVTTAARAVAAAANIDGIPCILALDDTMKDAFLVNSGTVQTSGCDLQVNSDHATRALYVNKQGSLEADEINTVGGYDTDGYVSSTPNSGAPSIADPLSGLAPPGFSGCDYTNVSFDTGSHNLSPGVYCGGVSVSGDAQVTMGSGKYIITQGTDPKKGTPTTGTLAVSGNGASISGDGVSVYMDGNSEVSVTGTGSVDLSAPISGTYAGILFFGDPNAAPTTEHMINGGGSTIFDGVMYFPTAIAKVNGNGAANTDADISAIIARQLRFGGNGALDFHIDGDAALPAAFIKLTLVE